MKALFIALLLCCNAVGFAQDNNIKASGLSDSAASRIYVNDVSTFTVDYLGNVYILTNKGLLKKYNNQGDSLNVFNDVRRYGAVSAIDAGNPLKVLIYYRDFSTAVMLDRFLSRINMIDFRKAGIFQAKAVATSYDNNVWIFDEQSAKLKKIGDDGKLLSETVDLRQVLDVIPSPDKIIDRDGFVYLYDKDNGLYVFDYYGALKNELAITGVSDIQVINTTIVGRKQNRFVRYTPGTIDMQEADLPEIVNKAKIIRIMPQGVYIKDARGIALFNYR